MAPKDTEHVLTNCNIFKTIIESEISLIVKQPAFLVEHDKIQKTKLHFSMRGTISKLLGEQIQEAEYLMILKVIAGYLMKIKFHVISTSITTQRLRPILPRLPVDPSVDRRQSLNNVEQGNS